MKKNLTRKQMIALIASDYGYGPETTNNIKTEVLLEVCNSKQPNIYLSSLLKLGNQDIFIEE